MRNASLNNQELLREWRRSFLSLAQIKLVIREEILIASKKEEVILICVSPS